MYNCTLDSDRCFKKVQLHYSWHAVERVKKVLILVSLSLFFTSSLFSQNTILHQKLDPAFRYLIEQTRQERTSGAKLQSPLFSVEATEGFATKDARVEKRFNAIVYTKAAKILRDKNIVVNSILPKFVTAWVTLEQIEQMANMPEVGYIDAPEMDYLHNDISIGASGASLLHQGRLNNTAYKGKNVIVAVFDTGIDWKHFDFRNPDDISKSRILRIWDQTLTAGAGEAPPTGYSYGVEYTQAQINDEIDGTPANYVREMDTHGHGTHVAGTAAGNGSALTSRKYTGMAPEADIIIIRGSTDQSILRTRIIDAITYLQGLATTLGRPVVLNLSLGSLDGPHDGTRADEVAVDNFTASGPGRVVIVSAGNDNGSNKHNRINLAGGTTSTVQFNAAASTTGNVFKYNIYANGNNSISATLTAPGVGSVTANVGQTSTGFVLNNNFNVVLNNAVDPANSHRYLDVQVSRNGSNTSSPEGIWTLTITNNSPTPITMDGWLYERTNESTSLVGGDNDYMTGSPGNATTAITVGSYVGKNSWLSASGGSLAYSTARQDSISLFSSRGPRRDNVLKPDITANGQAVISALSSSVSPPANNVVETGLYWATQGTSMAAPGVAGAVALLLQANPNATASQIKNLLTITATRDAMSLIPGATPSTTWGYGKLDVFKAASSLFNCLPTERDTYQYDASTRNSEEGGTTLSNTRVAVRFTPNRSGKLGGIFFHLSGSLESLVAEVRSNSGGNPGTLLGSQAIAGTTMSKYAWNYINLSNLNVSITSGVDYFVVLRRDPSGTSNWSLRRENVSLDNRSLTTEDGTNWSNPGFDYKIRSVVYSNSQFAGAIASANSIDNRNINTTNQFVTNNCEIIAQLTPNGLNPVSGVVNTRVWVEGSVPYYRTEPYVQRHYEITPASGVSTTTGRVTLYFKQAEFGAFNADPGSMLDLPANPTDNSGKANLRIVQFPGTSSNGTGSPDSYSGTPVVIDPADGNIIWNAEANRWEVTFDVTGFSGFIVQTEGAALPVVLEYFRGNKQGTSNVLNWKVNCFGSSVYFDILRSDDGNNFKSIGSFSATQDQCKQPQNFTDASPLKGKNFYRVKITEIDGRNNYTSTLLLQTDKGITTTIYPTIIKRGGGVQVNYAGAKGHLSVADAAGRQVYLCPITNGVQSIALPLQASGMYFYTIKNEAGTVSTGKIIVQ